MLTKFRLLHTEGLKGLHYRGDFIPFDKIDDTLAEELVGKTHVLERLAEAPATAAGEPAAEAGAPGTRRRAG